MMAEADSEMFWVVQEDLFQQNERLALLETLRRFAIPHQIVRVSGTYELIPEVTYAGPIITNGSIMLSHIAMQRGWTPGSLLNHAFSYEVWHPHLRDYLLNQDITFTTIAEADPELDKFFIRPSLDDKSFTGRVSTRADFRVWQADILHRQGTLAETRILYGPVRSTGQEHRHFIVDQAVISSSHYKLNGQANQSDIVDPYIVDFAGRMAALWQPARAFVLDTYVAGDDIGIVEIGCLSHAGFYAADVQKVVMALEAMHW